jgi:hypothetical protein
MFKGMKRIHKNPYKVLNARLIRDGEDITTLKVRMENEDIHNQFLKLQGYDLNTDYERINLEAYVAPDLHLDIQPTDQLKVELPWQKQTDGVKLRRKKRRDDSGEIDYSIVFVQNIPTRSKTSNMMHRAVVTVTLESRLD